MIVRRTDKSESDELEVNSSNFSSSPKAMATIADLKKGDTVSFYCIEAKNKKGVIIILQPLSYQVN